MFSGIAIWMIDDPIFTNAWEVVLQVVGWSINGHKMDLQWQEMVHDIPVVSLSFEVLKK